MSNSRFRAIPKSTTFTIPFKLEEATLLDWLIKLSHHSGKEACLLTLHLLDALNKKTDLTAKARIHFLKLINQYLKSYIARLDNPCWDAGFPLAMEERVYAEMITWNYLLLGRGFFIAATDATKKDDEIFAFAMALHALGQAQLHIAAVYSSPIDGFWHQLYEIFTLAEKRKLLQSEASSEDFKNITLNTLFVRLLIFQACDTNQFRPRDMRTIFNFLDKVCAELPIYPLFNGEKLLFLFDLHTDNPPMPIKKQLEFTSPSTRYFSPVIVAQNISLLLKRGDMWSGTLKSINNTLFRRVIKTLEQKQKRVYTRKNERRTLLGVIGFDDILGFLYAVTKKASLVSTLLSKTNLPTPKAPSPEVSLETDNVANDASTQPPQTVSSEVNDLNLSHKSIDAPQIWDTQKKDFHVPNKKVSLKKITVFDSSANGYSLYWNQVDAKAKVGDIFGIISDDKKRLEIAFIRRIAMSDNDNFRFGTEVIGFESEVVYILPIDNKEKGSWAIFIPGIELLNRPDTLIYETGYFKVGDGVYLYQATSKKLCVLVSELHSTAAISYVELAYPPSKKV
jgi:hypothetical protein